MWRIFEIFGLTKYLPKGIEYCVFGIGNPGIRYSDTRHNIGFRVVDTLCRSLDIKGNRRLKQAQITWGTSPEGRSILCIKPLTYVNRCGPVLKNWLERCRLPLSSCLVITDDLHLDPGVVRLRRGGSAGGHNGLKSIIGSVGKDFPRLRFGIGKVPAGTSTIDFVLGEFSAEEETIIASAINRASEAVLFFFNNGIDATMNKYNT
ncbi:MAG: aminoacyl-tRNA hydrolase [Chitinivibrionales bacterium]|nr:aminoacyl-tRNA hydrolase [Chitinivibrionales bacterium]